MKLFLMFTILGFSFYSHSQDLDPVVATVNGKKIKLSTLKNYHEQNLKFVRSDKKITVERSLNDLINRIIGVENAKKAKVHKRPDVIKKINDVIYNAYISDEISAKLKKIKEVTDQDIKKYYDKFPEYKTSQILLRVRPVPTKDEVANAYEAANKIYEEVLKNPKSFEALALNYSQTTNSQVGGDLGYQPKARLSVEYYNAIQGKVTGYVTKPFRSQYGVHVVKVTGVKSFEQIDKQLYKKIVYDQRRDKIMSNYFKNQRKKANIKINNEKIKL